MTDFGVTDVWTLWAIVGLTVVTILTRGFFILSHRDLHLPHWAQRGLHYAPIAALSAVIAPEVLMQMGGWPSHWRDARWPAVLAALLWYRWKKGVLGTIVTGMVVFLPLRIGLGW
jgi:branched-subunit amino acid transport protein